MDSDIDRYLSWTTCSRRGSKPNKRKTRDPENMNSNQKEGKGNAKEDHKRKSQDGRYDTSHTQTAETGELELKHVILDVTALAESSADSCQKVRQQSAERTKKIRQMKKQGHY